MVGPTIARVLGHVFIYGGRMVRIGVVCIMMVFGGNSIVMARRGKSRSIGVLFFISFIVAEGTLDVFDGVLHCNGRIRHVTGKGRPDRALTVGCCASRSVEEGIWRYARCPYGSSSN